MVDGLDANMVRFALLSLRLPGLGLLLIENVGSPFLSLPGALRHAVSTTNTTALMHRIERARLSHSLDRWPWRRWKFWRWTAKAMRDLGVGDPGAAAGRYEIAFVGLPLGLPLTPHNIDVAAHGQNPKGIRACDPRGIAGAGDEVRKFLGVVRGRRAQCVGRGRRRRRGAAYHANAISVITV